MEIRIARGEALGALAQQGRSLAATVQQGFQRFISFLGAADGLMSGGPTTERQRIERELFEPYHRYRHLD